MQEQAIYNMLKPMPEKLLFLNLDATHLIDYKETNDNLNLIVNSNQFNYQFENQIILNNALSNNIYSPLIVLIKARNFANAIIDCNISREQARNEFKNNIDNFRLGIYFRLSGPNINVYVGIKNFTWEENDYEYIWLSYYINFNAIITNFYFMLYSTLNCPFYIDKFEFYYLFHVGYLFNINFNAWR